MPMYDASINIWYCYSAVKGNIVILIINNLAYGIASVPSRSPESYSVQINNPF